MVVITVLFSACSKDSPTNPSNFNDGTITFSNSSSMTVVLERISHNRNQEHQSLELSRILGRGGRYMLPNLIDGGQVFHGGDRVSLNYRSRAFDASGNPLYTKSISFLVNGSSVVRIKGQAGEYEIANN